MFRSLLFVPGNNSRFIEKSKILKSDIICLDLEDSVSLNEKPLARKLIHDFLSKRSLHKEQYLDADNKEHDNHIFVRINSIDNGFYKNDLESIIVKGLDGIVIPKINNANEINNVVKIIGELETKNDLERNSIKLIPSIESARGVVNAFNICESSERIISVLFGVFDYLYDMHLDYREYYGLGYQYARSKIPVDARAAGVESMDGIWQKIDDIEGLIKDSEIAKQLGYNGKSIIHPSHIEHVQNIFFPSKSELEWAEKVVNSLYDSVEHGNGRGAIRLDGKMIDAVHYKQAKLILDYKNKHI